MNVTPVTLNTKKKDLAKRNRIILMRSGFKDVSDLARQIGRCRPHTSKVLYGHIKSEPTRKLIAKAFNRPETYIWPSRRRRAA
jgi:lambda repressor-like predicted transcriptional regulator